MQSKIGLIGAMGRLGKAIGAMIPVIPITRGTPIPSDCDLFIDVSTPEALLQNLPFIQKPIVIGITALSERHFDLIQNTSNRIPIFYSPNFSFGMALFRKIAVELAQKFPADIDLVETHHAEKKDAPSGSAKAIAGAIGKPIRIHSIRSGKIIGEHTLYFNTPTEKITLAHYAHSREVFAHGALKAASFLLKQPPGLYGMDDLV